MQINAIQSFFFLVPDTDNLCRSLRVLPNHDIDGEKKSATTEVLLAGAVNIVYGEVSSNLRDRMKAERVRPAAKAYARVREEVQEYYVKLKKTAEKSRAVHRISLQGDAIE